jgi:hypothetical protein
VNCVFITNKNTKCCMFSNRDGSYDITISGITFKKLSEKEYYFFINNF